MRPIEITTTLKVWTTSDYSMRCLMDAVQAGDPNEAASSLFYTNSEMDKTSDPWTCVGEAEVRVQLYQRDQLVQSHLATLNAELEHARAEWLTKQQALLERISKLQALTNEVQA